jgi:signal transduction histidine kinase/CheY-like chemotaxis protein
LAGRISSKAEKDLSRLLLAGSIGAKTPKSRLRKSIMVTIVLVVVIWGILVTVFYRYALREALDKEGVSNDVINDVITDFMILSTVGTVVAMVFVMIVAYFLSKAITDPVNKLIKGVSEMTRGNLDTFIELDSGGELGQLAASFNRMAEERKKVEEDLRSYTLKLEQQTTDLMRAEGELEKLVSTMNALVENVPMGVVLLDSDNRVVFANVMGDSCLRSLTGHGGGNRLTNIAGRPLKEFLVSPSNVMRREVEIAGHPKSVFAVAGRSIVQEDDVTGMVLVMKDVTKEKEIEARALSQERLAAVGQLASGIAHDFNNVLTCVIGYSEMLHGDPDLSPDSRNKAEAILQSGLRATELIGQILDFSRSTARELKVVDLGAFLRDFLKFMERIIPETIDVVIDSEPVEYKVKADITKLQQVLANLAVNARDAMPSGGRLGFGLIQYRQEEHEEPLFHDMFAGDWVILGVSDSGPGISPDILPHIYEPFYTTKDTGTGTGLGLAQVYGIVKQHGGFIDVKTKYDPVGGKGGTSFVVYLPIAGGQVEAALTEADVEMSRGRGETLLVVEDDKIVRYLLEKILVGAGYRTISASDGMEALKLFEIKENEIDLCITDVVMPEMDGIELSRELKKRKPTIKVIALSGYPLGIGEEEFNEAGVVELIQKPFQSRNVIESVQSALKTER